MHRFALLSSRPGRVLAAGAGLICVIVVAAMAALWPRDEPRPRTDALVSVSTDSAEVVAVRAGGCEDFAGPGCKLVEFRLRSGSRAGERSFLPLAADEFSPRLSPGDRIRVSRSLPGGIDPALADRLPIDDPSQQPYAFIDFERERTLLWFTVAFACFVVALGRWQGLRSLIGLGVSLAVIVEFVVPAILDGRPPLLVALTGGLAVMLLTMGLTHGVGLKSVAAMLGTTAALLLTAVLALGAVKVAFITGLSDEQSLLLRGTSGEGLSLQGLILAGIVIGALGVLDDVTISQSATVLALRRANPGYRFRRLFAEGLSVGRDHLGATVNTLVLAYVGAALPVLLIFSAQGTRFGDAVNREPVAQEIVAMLVGSTGLIAAVPLTTALAALLGVRLPASAVPQDEHGHAH